MLTVDKIKEVVSKNCKKYGVKSAYLFGSYAKNTATNGSDIDLIIEKGEMKSYKDYFHLCEDLEAELGTEIDLLTDKSITPRFFNIIKNDRILLYGN